MVITISRLITLGLLLLNVVLVSSAQLLLKMGSSKVASLMNKDHLINSFFKIAFSPYIFFGILCYVFSLILWIYIMTRAQLSVAYPFMSLSYVVVMILAVLFVNETVNLPQWGGAVLIVIGTSVIFFFK